MRRRQALSALALIAAGSAGCANTPAPTPSPPRGTPEPIDGGNPVTTPAPIEVTEFATSEGPGGDLAVDLTVYNPADRHRQVRLVLTAGFDGTTRSVTRDLDLSGGERTDLSVTVPLSYADWDGNGGSLDFAFEYD